MRDLCLVPLKWHPMTSKVHAKTDLSYGNEADVEGLVSLVLEDVVDAETLGKLGVKIRHQHSIVGGLRPDIYIIVKIQNGERLAIGVCEVKKPDDASRPGARDVEDPVVLGQLHTYLKILQTSYGVLRPFGIVTTYERWRFGWLPVCDGIAASPSVDAPNFTPAPVSDLDKLGVADLTPRASDNKSTGNPASASASAAGKRTLEALSVSRVYNATDLDLVDTIASVLLKTASSPRAPPEILDTVNDRTMVSEGKNEIFFNKLSFAKADFRLGPVRRVTQLYLLHDLGDGRDGRVWLGATTGGHGCVVKFLKTKVGHRAVDVQGSGPAEAQRWRDIWGLNAYSATFAGKVTVVMPYIHPVSKEQWANSWHDRRNGVKGLVEAAVRRMAAAGFLHNDLKCPHVGLYLLNGVQHAAFMDLTDVKAVATAQEKEAAVAKMLADLEGSRKNL